MKFRKTLEVLRPEMGMAFHGHPRVLGSRTASKVWPWALFVWANSKLWFTKMQDEVLMRILECTTSQHTGKKVAVAFVDLSAFANC